MAENVQERINELKGIIEVKDKIIAELNRDMNGTLMELKKLREQVKELEGRV